MQEIVMDYTFSLDNFEGPLSLLDELVGVSKLDITELDLAKVTDQYLSYLAQMKQFNVELASEFFRVAATLIYIKTKMLLPFLVTEDEEFSDSENLADRLNEYRYYKGLGGKFQKYWEDNRSQYFVRKFVKMPLFLEESNELSEMTAGDLFHSILRYKGFFLQKSVPLKKLYVSVEQKISKIMQLFVKNKRMKVSEIMLDEKQKSDKIATFLGIADMIYHQKLSCNQKKIFEDFIVFRKGI